MHLLPFQPFFHFWNLVKLNIFLIHFKISQVTDSVKNPESTAICCLKWIILIYYFLSSTKVQNIKS